MCLSVYMIIALYSCIFASRRLARPGISKANRKYFLQQHFFYVAVFILVWGLYLANTYY